MAWIYTWFGWVQVADPPVPRVPTEDELFVPKYETKEGKNPVTGEGVSLNDKFYASDETAKWLVKKFGAVFQFVPDFGPSMFSIPVGRHLFFSPLSRLKRAGQPSLSRSAFIVNAGQLAAIFERNPPADFPSYDPFYTSLAEKLAWDYICLAHDEEVVKQQVVGR